VIYADKLELYHVSHRDLRLSRIIILSLFDTHITLISHHLYIILSSDRIVKQHISTSLPSFLTHFQFITLVYLYPTRT
jgi:hypothetical protein